MTNNCTEKQVKNSSKNSRKEGFLALVVQLLLYAFIGSMHVLFFMMLNRSCIKNLLSSHLVISDCSVIGNVVLFWGGIAVIFVVTIINLTIR